MNYSIVEVHKDEIFAGDTILYDGHITTVNEYNISKCSFMGKTLFGDSYRLGRILVKKVLF